MEPTDLTVRILQDIREDIRGLRQAQEGFTREVVTRFEKIDERFEKVDARFETIETSLRDLTQQLVILGRGVKVAIEQRAKNEERLDEHERRIEELEKRLPT